MLGLFHAGPTLFRTGWFVESLATQTLVIFAVRTRRVPFVRSRPSPELLAAALGIVAIGAALPFTPLADPLGFTGLPGDFFAVLVGMVVAYLLLIEVGKRPGSAMRRPADGAGYGSRETRAMTHKLSLDALAREQLEAARRAPSHRSARTVAGGHETTMRQTVLALCEGASLDEHENPGEATVLVLQGRVELTAGTDRWQGRDGDLILVPNARHALSALTDSVLLLTAVPLARSVRDADGQGG